MKTAVADPWRGIDVAENCFEGAEDRFEDSFVEEASAHTRLADSEEYLQKLYSRLKNLQGRTSKKDLVNSLSVAREECIARLITSKQTLETEEESELATNPLIRHIAPHLQALTASELVHLLKADVLQVVADADQEVETEKEQPKEKEE